MIVQFYRWDRENDLDPSLEQSDYEFYVHFYGARIDRLLDELVGGGGFDRRAEWPTAEVPETAVTITLHEDGPTFMFVLEQLPAFMSAAAAVFTAWMAWRRAREVRSRFARIEIGGHTYTGPASSVEELGTVVRMLAALAPEERAPS